MAMGSRKMGCLSYDDVFEAGSARAVVAARLNTTLHVAVLAAHTESSTCMVDGMVGWSFARCCFAQASLSATSAFSLSANDSALRWKRAYGRSQQQL